MTVKESLIRDHLAVRLDVLDDRMQLVRKEFPLPNGQGAGGFIDILARDELGHNVIIEIKRSNQAARAALHELTKYVALLKSELGVPATQLRAILVSTDWHELRVPFSEYLRVCEIPVEGYEIQVDTLGKVTCAKKFVPLPLEESTAISHEQFIYFFKTKAGRDAALERISADRKSHENCDFVILQGEYGGTRPIVYEHALYIAFSPCAALQHQDVQVENSRDDNGVELWHDDDDDDDAEGQRDSAQLGRLLELLPSTRDDAEIGMPEKLKTMVSNGWHMDVAHRSGRFHKNTLVMTDNDVFQEVQKTKGGAHYYLFAIASPRYAPAWKKMREDCRRALNSNVSWLAMIEQVLDDVAYEETQATVSLSIFCPGNVVASLVKLYQGEVDYLPSFELIVSANSVARSYLGCLSWDGQPVRATAQAWMTQSYGSLEQFMFKQHFHVQGEDDEAACKALGLKYIMVLLDPTGEADSDLFIDATGGRAPRRDVALRSVIDFPILNSEFGRQLIELIGSVSYGLVE